MTESLIPKQLIDDFAVKLEKKYSSEIKVFKVRKDLFS